MFGVEIPWNELGSPVGKAIGTLGVCMETTGVAKLPILDCS